MSEEHEPVPFQAVELDHLEPSQALTRLIRYASDLSASDLFFTRNEKDMAVSIRYLGILRSLTHVTPEEGVRLINYVKSISGMDLAQRLRPLDGRSVWAFEDDKKIDLRINTIPTFYGEDMSIHLLERDLRLLEVDHLGLQQKDLYTLKRLLNSNSGLILVTGPTGYGKTTTLYACLHYLNDGTRKINTIEDPVEYVLDGICQSQIRPKIDLGFPELLRSVLRQAPDVIMVGEIRDPVTAETAVRAANSGHMVFATLHAPMAAGAIDSMLSLDVHPHFLASSLSGVVTQRLLRKLCQRCRIPFDLSESPETFQEITDLLKPGQGETAYAPAGCKHCFQEGYIGRTGVFEVLRVIPKQYLDEED